MDNHMNSIVVGYIPPGIPPTVRKRKDIVLQKQYNFEMPPVPIPPADIKGKIDAEVVVVGLE